MKTYAKQNTKLKLMMQSCNEGTLFAYKKILR